MLQGMEGRAPDPFERCLGFLAAFVRRRARRVAPFAHGCAVVAEELPRAWDLNAVWVTAGEEAEAGQLAAEAERLQGAAGLAHRRLIVPGGAGRRFSGELAPVGWQASELLVMHQARATTSTAEAAVVELSPDRLEPVWAAGIRRAPWADEETVRQLVAAQHLRRNAAEVRYFAVVVDDAIVSTCELFRCGDAAQIESVMTERRFRGRGYASAVLARASREARLAGCDLVFLLVGADEGPARLYERLGFAAAGSLWQLTRYPA
jgi:GNAT superfamily N-acetyltransferase